jgi:alkanesulfonate monooxygenase SsuD/methylene tetrahydromethanopterin reductase-like flavin-dependent oxidoreductase (luciferase family)
MAEQVRVLRALWTQPSVTFHGRWHTITAAGLNPMPIQRPIPIWMGGESDAVIRRVARLADGWLPGGGLQNERARHPATTREAQLDRLRVHMVAAGRDPGTMGIEGRVSIARGGPDDWRREVEQWRVLGATHVSVSTMRAGLGTPQAHVDAARRFMEAVRG